MTNKKVIKQIWTYGKTRVYGLKDVIDIDCKFKGLTVEEMVEKDRKSIIKLTQECGVDFTDEVFSKARFNRVRYNERIIQEVVERQPIKTTKTYKKDTESIENVIKSINILDTSDVMTSTDEKDDNLLEEDETHIIDIVPQNNLKDEDF